MKSARDPNVDYKKLVREGYDQCGEDYSKQRKERANSELKLLLKMLNSGANVLDIGCGGGVPICREIASKCEITGVNQNGGDSTSHTAEIITIWDLNLRRR